MDMSIVRNLFDFQEFGPVYRKLDPSVERVWHSRFHAPMSKIQTVLKTMRVLTVSSAQTPGKLNLSGQPNVVQPPGYSDTDHTIVRQADRTELTTEIIIGLMKNADKWRRMEASQLIEDKVLDMKRKQYLLQEVMLAHQFVYGRINFNSANNVLAPTVHATTGALTNHVNSIVTIDFGVPDRNRGNLNGRITAQWSVAGTDIQKQLDAIDKDQADRGCPPIAEIHLNVLDKHHLLNNTLFQTWAQHNQAATSNLLQNNFVDGLFGKKWVFHRESYTAPVGGAVTDLLPQTFALFVPANGPWLRSYEGFEPMDKDSGTSKFASVQEAMNDMAFVPGEFGYVAKTPGQPPSYWMNGINNWGSAFADPTAILCGKVFTG